MEKREIHDKPQRLISYDILRILAVLGVILIHIASAGDKHYASTWQWEYCNFIESTVRWAVPAFVMISGSFLLDKRHPLSSRKLLHKTIRLVSALVIWSFLYALFQYLFMGITFLDFVGKFVFGHSHLWYLYMLIGLYLGIPILRQVTLNEKVVKYYLLLTFFVGIILPTVEKVSGASTVTKFIDRFYLNQFTGYLCYFLLGYYLKYAAVSFSKIQVKLLYLLGCMGFLAIWLSASILSRRAQQIVSYSDNLLLPDFLLSLAIFVYFTRRKHGEKKRLISDATIIYLSQLTFGVYLCHAFFLYLMTFLHISVVYMNPILSFPLNLLLISILSFCVSAVLHKIPFLSHYCC